MIIIHKLVHRLKHPYRNGYKNYTHYELFINDEKKCEIVIGERFSTFKNFLKFVQEKYNFNEYKLVDMGVIYLKMQT